VCSLAGGDGPPPESRALQSSNRGGLELRILRGEIEHVRSCALANPVAHVGLRWRVYDASPVEGPTLVATGGAGLPTPVRVPRTWRQTAEGYDHE